MRGLLRSGGALVLLAACSNTGGIEGRVVSHLDGTPVAGVVVAIDGTALTAATDASGAYALKDVQPGLQKVVVTSPAVTATAPLEVTVGTRATVQAAELRVLPYPAQPGVYEVRGTDLVGLSLPESAKVRPVLLGLDIAYGVSATLAPVSSFTGVSSPLVLLVRDDQVAEQTFRLVPTRTERAFFGDVMVPFGARPEPIWVVRQRGGVDIAVEHFPRGLHMLRGAPGKGAHALVRDLGGRLAISFLRVKPPGPVLTAPVGTYPEGSPEYMRAQEAILAWCESPAAPPVAETCARAKPLLTATADAECPGELVLPPGEHDAPQFMTSPCEGHVFAAFSREEDGWYVDRVEIRPPEGDVPGEDDGPAVLIPGPNEAKEARRMKLLEQMREQARQNGAPAAPTEEPMELSEMMRKARAQ
ncbi:MAG: carboxypeptidase-like regulatory domain-containing protein [Myxococcota bacterium]